MARKKGGSGWWSVVSAEVQTLSAFFHPWPGRARRGTLKEQDESDSCSERWRVFSVFSGIAFVYGQYVRLMNAWRNVLPQRAMMEIRYEDLVVDRESVTRDLIAFCGLEWNDACLNPERNRRSVATPSMWQVRQAVYSTSIGRSRNFATWLGEFNAFDRSPMDFPESSIVCSAKDASAH